MPFLFNNNPYHEWFLVYPYIVESWVISCLKLSETIDCEHSNMMFERDFYFYKVYSEWAGRTEKKRNKPQAF